MYSFKIFIFSWESILEWNDFTTLPVSIANFFAVSSHFEVEVGIYTKVEPLCDLIKLSNSLYLFSLFVEIDLYWRFFLSGTAKYFDSSIFNPV